MNTTQKPILPTPEVDAFAQRLIDAKVPASRVWPYWYDCAATLERMRDEARAELAAMREAIKEAHCLLKWTVDSSCGRHHVGVSDALAKLQPFLK